MDIIELEPQLLGLTRAEKAHFLQLLARDIGNAWPGVEKTPGVVGGEARITRTRIPIWALENYRRLGWNEARILENYPCALTRIFHIKLLKYYVHWGTMC